LAFRLTFHLRYLAEAVSVPACIRLFLEGIRYRCILLEHSAEQLFHTARLDIRHELAKGADYTIEAARILEVAYYELEAARTILPTWSLVGHTYRLQEEVLLVAEMQAPEQVYDHMLEEAAVAG
jgi:hypothetical protein